MLFQLFGFYINILEIPVIAYLIFMGLFDLYLYGTRYQLGWSKKTNFDVFLLLALLFLGSILLSSLSSSSLTMILKGFFKWVEIFLIAFLVFLYAKDFGRFKIVYWLIFLSTIASILFSFYQIFSNKLVFFQERILLGYDSLYAFSLIFSFWQKKGKIISRLLSIFLLLLAFFTLSRGVLIGIFLVLLAYQKVYNNKKLVLQLAAIFIIIGVVGIVTIEPFQQFVFNRVEEIFTLKNISNVERISLIRYAFLGFGSSPLWGIGSLNFPLFLAQNDLSRGLVAKDLSVLAPHNLFVQILIEQGIYGFVIICLIFFFLYIILKKSWRVFGDSCELKPYLLGVQFFAVSVLITVSLGFIANQFRLNFALFIGLTISLMKLPKKGIWQKESNEK